MAKIPPEPDLSFEKSLEQLEALVAFMESGDISLDALVEKFEEGSRLVKQCEERLQQAELKIQKLRADNEKLALEAFAPDEA